jgi:acetyl-CoA carboxylase biotin carboxylase subunit
LRAHRLSRRRHVRVLFENGKFYFIEMNTRIQVEHPVTEMITGVDLVREQLLIARRRETLAAPAGRQVHTVTRSCAASTPRIRTRSWPSPGTVKRFHPAGGPGVRMDTHIYDGYRIPPNYDSMIGKLIVHGRDRDTAIARIAHRARRTGHRRRQKPTSRCSQRILADGGFQHGGQNIHYLEKRIAEQREKNLTLV